jgi:hypothetical protein
MNAKRWEIGLAGVEKASKEKESEELNSDKSDEDGDESIQVGLKENSR